jgi:spermidine/putrescine transport system permease protein
MTTVTPAPVLEREVGAPPPPRARPGRRGGRLLHVYTWALICYLMAPILIMILFGFNNTKGKLNVRWQGFTLSWYKNLLAIPELTTALKNSLTIALFSTLLATVFGTMMGIALGRWRYRGRGTTDLVLFANIAAPELVLGAALLSLLVTAQIPRGYLTILIAHVMFNIPFVAVTVRARMAGFDLTLEEAAQDLGANPQVTFWKVTFPLIFPGILAGALLAFALSIDDYIITSFVAGQTITFPLWVFGATRIGVPPQVNVMGTLIFVGGILLAVLNAVYARRRSLQ